MNKLQDRSAGPSRKLRSLRRALSFFLVASLLTPNWSFAQPTPPPSIGPSAPGRPVTAPTPSAGASRTVPGPDYRLGPGDILDVQIASRLDVERTQVVVNTTGTISVPTLGPIAARRLALLQAQR